MLTVAEWETAKKGKGMKSLMLIEGIQADSGMKRTV